MRMVLRVETRTNNAGAIIIKTQSAYRRPWTWMNKGVKRLEYTPIKTQMPNLKHQSNIVEIWKYKTKRSVRQRNSRHHQQLSACSNIFFVLGLIGPNELEVHSSIQLLFHTNRGGRF